MMQGEKNPTLNALKATLPPGAGDFLDYCEKSLWNVTERCAAKMGLTPMEQNELAVRMVRAAIKEFAAAAKRVQMRDTARRAQ